MNNNWNANGSPVYSAPGVSYMPDIEIGEPYVCRVDELESETRERIGPPVPPVVEPAGTVHVGAAASTGCWKQTIKGVARREKNYTIKEDEMLCMAYLNVSKALIVGSNQSRGYWARIVEYYHEHKEVPSQRSLSSLQHRWGGIQKETTRFCEFYDKVQKMNGSRKNDDDKLKDALQMFEGVVGSSFSYTHCWRILHHEKKWNDWLASLIHKDKAATVPPSLADRSSDTEDSEASGQPTGRDRAKKQRSQGSTLSSTACLGVLDKNFMDRSTYEEHQNEHSRDLLSCADRKLAAQESLADGAAASTGHRKQTTKGVARREKNYTVKEDEMICIAYLNVSKEPVVDCNQSSGRYWVRIVEYYHAHKVVPSKRSMSSLQHRWGSIQKETTRFCEFYDKVHSLNESGKNDDDKLNDALQMFEGTVGSSFSYIHCWRILRYEKKWNDWLVSVIHKDKEAMVPPTTADRSSDTEDCEASEHLTGRDRATVQRSQGSTSSIACLDELQNMSMGRSEEHHDERSRDLLSRADRELAAQERLADGAVASTGCHKQPTKGIARREKNYTVKEDEMLCIAYLNVSKDPIVGCNQSSGGYWTRIVEYYHTHKQVPSKRSPCSLQHRWGGIQKDTTRFCEFYDKVQRMNESKKNDDDKLNDALQMFEGTVGSSFSYIHCWRILCHEKKWNAWLSSLIQKDKVSTVPPNPADRSSDTEDSEASGHLTGRDRAKKQQSQGSTSSSIVCLDVLQNTSMDRSEEHHDERSRDLLSHADCELAAQERLVDGAAASTGCHKQPTKGIARREKNYTVKEDEMLCVAYLNVSKDPIVGCNQYSGGYWARIVEYYHGHKVVPSNRSLSSLQHRWGGIQKDTSRFCEFYDRVQRMNERGKNDNDKLNDALQMFKATVGSSFSYTHCWRILRQEKKWNDWLSSLKDKAATVPRPADRSSETEDSEASGQPTGRDREKKQRSQGGTSSSIACLEVLQKMSMDKSEERHDEHSRDLLSHADRKVAVLERLAAAQERLAAAQEFEQEQRIMSIDVEKVVPWHRDYYLRLQQKIIQKHTSGGI